METSTQEQSCTSPCFPLPYRYLIPACFLLIPLVILDFQILTCTFRSLFSFISSTCIIQLSPVHHSLKTGFSQNLALNFPFVFLPPNLSGPLRALLFLTAGPKTQSLCPTHHQSPIFLQTHPPHQRERRLTETEIMQVLCEHWHQGSKRAPIRMMTAETERRERGKGHYSEVEPTDLVTCWLWRIGWGKSQSWPWRFQLGGRGNGGHEQSYEFRRAFGGEAEVFSFWWEAWLGV